MLTEANGGGARANQITDMKMDKRKNASLWSPTPYPCATTIGSKWFLFGVFLKKKHFFVIGNGDARSDRKIAKLYLLTEPVSSFSSSKICELGELSKGWTLMSSFVQSFVILIFSDRAKSIIRWTINLFNYFFRSLVSRLINTLGQVFVAQKVLQLVLIKW